MIWLALAGVGLAFLAWRYARLFGVARAQESFRLQAGQLETAFRAAAAATGKPRGLVWEECRFQPEWLLAREQGVAGWVGLVPVEIRFSAVVGSDMDGLPAVPDIRTGSAVLRFHRGHWTATGRVLMNLSPGEVLAHFPTRFRPIAER